MTDAILIINAGSSSIKFAVYQADAALAPLIKGKIEGIGTAPRLTARDGDGNDLTERTWNDRPGHTDLLAELLSWLEGQSGGNRLIAAGHRVVHGGAEFAAPLVVTPEVLERLEALTTLAPLHQPHNLTPIRALTDLRPELPHVACFDTAFHRTLTQTAARFAVPRELEEAGIRRYGFHGISYEYIAQRIAELNPWLADKRVIVAHLGNGASLCAMQAGRSIDTTMGFTALDGLMMGTRPGSIDPGVILYLQQQFGMTFEALEDLLYHRCGLLGVSGVSSDMRSLETSADFRAREAIELFIFRVAREAGGMAMSLGGLDAFVFTAGIGENSARVRKGVCEALSWLGAKLDDDANERGEGIISAPDSKIGLWVIPTDEEKMIARHTFALAPPGTAA